jgi:hypothetical protein
MKRKIGSFLLALFMTISLLPGMTAKADGDTQVVVDDPVSGFRYVAGTGSIRGIYDKSKIVNGVLSIPQVINSHEVSDIQGFDGMGEIASVTIPNTVKSIGPGAFKNCINLTEITLDAATTLDSITSEAFEGCVKLAAINLPDSLTGIGDHAFDGCSALSSVTFGSNPHLSSIEEYAFQNCTTLSSISLPESMTALRYTGIFNGCMGLLSVSLPTSLTEIAQNSFSGCTGLTQIEIPANVTGIGTYAFSDCSNLQTITFSGTSKLAKIWNGAFSGCKQLKSITIPPSVTSITANTFLGCESLTSVTIPATVTSIDTTGLFRGCIALASVSLPETATNSIGKQAFSGCRKLASIALPDSVFTIEQEAFAECPKLSSVTFGTKVTSIGKWAFTNCDSLENITIPKSVTTIGDLAFSTCDILASIGFEAASALNTIGADAFNGCKALSAITLPAGLKTIGDSTFNGCASLKNVNIPEGVTVIGNWAFAFCDTLTDITVSPGNAVFASQDGVLLNKTETTVIQYPENNAATAYTVPATVTTIGKGAFSSCNFLESVTLPASVTSVSQYAFYDFPKLKSVAFRSKTTTISAGAFSKCANLTIHGETGSTAQTYATSNSIPFVADTSGGVCQIGSVSYDSLGAALAASISGDTITLLDDITYSSQITLNNKTLTVATNAHTLTIDTTSDAAVRVEQGGVLNLDTTGGGAVNAAGKLYGVCSVNGGTATVSSAVATGAAGTPGYGIWANGAGSVTVTGSVSGDTGANVSGGGHIVIGGNITYRNEGVYATGAGSTVTATSSVSVVNSVSGNTATGVDAENGATISVGGNITATNCGAQAKTGSTITVTGNVYGKTVGADATGNGSTVTIGGVLTTGGTYIYIGGTAKAELTSRTLPTTKTDYFTYNDTPVSTAAVWVKIPNLTVAAATVSDITASGAKLSGGITAGGSAAIEWGFVYSAAANPTTGNSKVDVTGSSTDKTAFNTTLTGLTAGSTYHVRAYAVNDAGTVYGADNSFVVLSTVEYVCSIGTTSYETLGEALTAVTTGQTITLLKDISYSGSIVVSGKSVVFALNSHTLTVTNPSGTALEVGLGGSVQYTGSGAFHCIGSGGSLDKNGNAVSGLGVYAHDGGVAQVTHASASLYDACYAVVGGTITVNGNVAGGTDGYGAIASDSGKITVTGDASGTMGGARAGWSNNTTDAYRSVVTVAGNATGTSAESTGVGAVDNGKVVVGKNVSGGKYGVYASCAGECSEAVIGGNVTATAADGVGVYADNLVLVTVDGTISGNSYIVLIGSAPYGSDFYTTLTGVYTERTIPTTKTGYITYSAANSYGHTDANPFYVTVWVKDTSGGGTGSTGTSGGSSSAAYAASVTGGGTLSLAVDQTKHAATATLTSKNAEAYFENGKTVITLPTIAGINSYKLELPAAALSGTGGAGALTVSTGAGSLVVLEDMLSILPDITGKTADIVIGKGDASSLTTAEKAAIGDRPIVQLTLMLDGVQIAWNNPGAPVTVTIPYTPTTEELENPGSIVIWYLDGSGTPVCVPNGHYDAATGAVTFSATHFSQYAIGYNVVRFNDVASGAWYADAVTFLAARGVTTGTTDTTFSPEATLTRGQFIVMLMRAYGISPDVTVTDNFADAGSTYYTNYLGAAKRQGISNGIGSNLFAPEQAITRQEMFTMLYNALKTIGALPSGRSGMTLADYADNSGIASWAKEAVTLLVETGKISGSGGMLSPAANSTRAEMAQALYNLLMKA